MPSVLILALSRTCSIIKKNSENFGADEATEDQEMTYEKANSSQEEKIGLSVPESGFFWGPYLGVLEYISSLVFFEVL